MVFRFIPHRGGAVIVASEIANNLAKLGHHVTVLTPDFELVGESYEPKMHHNVKIIRVETPSRTNLKVAARRCKTNLLKKGNELGNKEKFDFVLTIFHPFHLVPNAAIACAKKLDIPSIVKVDDAIYEKSSGLKSLQRKIEKMISSKVLKDASKILVVNENTGKIMRSYYNVDQNKIEIVPNGVDLSFFNSKNKNEKKIVFSGVMYHHRGLDVLLDSVPKVLEKFPLTEFCLLGDGPEMDKLKNIVKEKNIEKNVKFEGWLDRNQIPEKISDALIGIGPLKRTTVTENALPIKVLEYMASSIPIIAKKGTLPNDVLNDNENGFFVDDSKDLANKIIELLNDPQKAKLMGERSLEKVQNFSWSNIVNSIIQIKNSI